MEALGDTLKHLVLPVIALATIPGAIIARMTRSSMLDVLQADYVRTAHSKGLREGVVLSRHALKNAFLPIITIIGLQTGSLLAGAILLLIALVFVLANLLVDISYAYLDPRIHYD
jgi:peptide/nickel transport system permease protein